jgi:hypothetical protein
MEMLLAKHETVVVNSIAVEGVADGGPSLEALLGPSSTAATVAAVEGKEAGVAIFRPCKLN